MIEVVKPPIGAIARAVSSRNRHSSDDAGAAAVELLRQGQAQPAEVGHLAVQLRAVRFPAAVVRFCRCSRVPASRRQKSRTASTRDRCSSLHSTAVPPARQQGLTARLDYRISNVRRLPMTSLVEHPRRLRVVDPVTGESPCRLRDGRRRRRTRRRRGGPARRPAGGRAWTPGNAAGTCSPTRRRSPAASTSWPAHPERDRQVPRRCPARGDARRRAPGLGGPARPAGAAAAVGAPPACSRSTRPAPSSTCRTAWSA